jgi:tetratricopeptide (TPR) repeat protein
VRDVDLAPWIGVEVHRRASQEAAMKSRCGRGSAWVLPACAVAVILGPLGAGAQTPAQPPAAPGVRTLTTEERGDIYMARKMYREAIDAYLAAKSPSAQALNKVGIAYQQQSDLVSAKRYYERAVKADPKYAEAINNIGTVLYSTKNFRRATSMYKKALTISPRSASILSNLGTAYFARRDYKEAFEIYQKALEIDPTVFEHHGHTGTLLEQRDIEERAKFSYYMARVYAKQGMNDLALLYIRKALENGFKERRRFIEDVEFAGLQKLPEFEELMKLEPKVL